MRTIIKFISLVAMSHIVLGQNLTVSFELEERCICLGMPGVWTAVLTNRSDTTITIYPSGSHNGQGMKYMYDLFAVDKEGDTLKTQRPGLMLGGGRKIEFDVKIDSEYRETAFIIDYIPLKKPGIYEIGFNASIGIKGERGGTIFKASARKTQRLKVRKCGESKISKLLSESIRRILTTDTSDVRLDSEQGLMLNLESKRLSKSNTGKTFWALDQILEYPNLYVIVNAKRGMQKIDPLKAEESISKIKNKYGEECELLINSKRSIPMTARNKRCTALFKHN